MRMIDQVFPVKKQVPLEGLYLHQKLLDMAAHMGRSRVLTDYLTDKNGVVAKAGKEGQFQIPAELKNASDWDRYQELMAQADVTISGGAYSRLCLCNFFSTKTLELNKNICIMIK
jgi:hypothetical protein